MVPVMLTVRLLAVLGAGDEVALVGVTRDVAALDL